VCADGLPRLAVNFPWKGGNISERFTGIDPCIIDNDTNGSKLMFRLAHCGSCRERPEQPRPLPRLPAGNPPRHRTRLLHCYGFGSLESAALQKPQIEKRPSRRRSVCIFTITGVNASLARLSYFIQLVREPMEFRACSTCFGTLQKGIWRSQ
jgi:hypothetical protein